MRLSRYLTLGVITSLSVTVGTTLIGWGTATPVGAMRPELRLGGSQPGAPRMALPTTWTPRSDKNGNTITVNLPLEDSRIQRFADFPVLTPGYLPAGCDIKEVTLYWDPTAGKRIVQLVVGGKFSGLITQQRLQRHDPLYPAGIYLTSVRETNGTGARNVQTAINGIGVSMAWNLLLSDDQILEVVKHLRHSE